MTDGFLEILMEGGVKGSVNPGGRGGVVLQEITVGGEGDKKHAIHQGCVELFWNNPIDTIKSNGFCLISNTGIKHLQNGNTGHFEILTSELGALS